MPKNSPLLKITGLRVERDNVTLLSAIDWTVRHGENWVILGPNGSGKTSLIRTLCGYLSPTAGAIELLGKEYGRHDWRDLRPKIGVVSHTLHASIPPAETALETVISGHFAQLDLWAKPTKLQRSNAHAYLKALGAEDLASRPWLFLSQGEKQKVMIARALMAKPHLLILDEPCSGLDPVARQRLLASLTALSKGAHHPPLLLITHHVEEITPIFTHALLLKEGSVVGSGNLRSTLTSRLLSATFATPVRVHRHQKQWSMRLASA